MQCRHCGTEIAAKAIICFRCGQATADPVRKAVPVRPARSGQGLLLAALVAMVLAVVLWAAGSYAADPGTLRVASGVVAVIGAACLIVRVIRRR
jgi:hypothetical protein